VTDGTKNPGYEPDGLLDAVRYIGGALGRSRCRAACRWA